MVWWAIAIFGVFIGLIDKFYIRTTQDTRLKTSL